MWLICKMHSSRPRSEGLDCAIIEAEGRRSRFVNFWAVFDLSSFRYPIEA
jgi:hypothetical protein